MKKDLSAKSSIVRVWAYTRVSTEEQAQRENNSLGTQRSYCEQYVQLNELEGWKLMRVIEDPGHSAATLKRPGMEELIEAIEGGQVDVVLIYKLDRLTRSLKDFYILWELMDRHGVNFVSATEKHLDTTTALGRMILQIILLFAQFEREQTVQRLKDKFAQAARNGERHPGVPPYGYKGDYKKRTLVVDKDEARVVRQMFEWAVERGSVAAVARALNAAGHRTRVLTRYKGSAKEYTVGGKPWNTNKVLKILQNVAYKAVRLDGDGKEYPAQWKPLVSKKVWEQANRAIRRLDEKESGKPIKRENFTNKSKALLKGLLHCGSCGNAMTPKAGGKKNAEGIARSYYTCQSVVQFGAASGCTLRSITATGFDAFAVRLIGEFGKNPSLIKQTIQASKKNKTKSVRPLKSRLQELKAELRQACAEIANCLKLARTKGSGSFTEELLAEANGLSERKHVLQREIDSLKAEIDYLQQSSSDENLIAEALCNFEESCQHLTFDERVEVIRLLVESIQVERIDPDAGELKPHVAAPSQADSVHWHRLKFNFHIKELVGAAEGGPDPTLKPANARTEVEILAGLAGFDWSKGGFAVHPFKLDERRLEASTGRVKFTIYKKRHILATALKWKQQLEDNPHLAAQDIASQIGVSAARVRQILRLAKLNPGIQEYILSLPEKEASRHFSEHILRKFVVLKPEEQFTRFSQKWPDHTLGSE